MYDISANEVLFERALATLVKNELLLEETDDFGPSLYRKSNLFDEWWYRRRDSHPLFRKFYEMGEEGYSWLKRALVNMHEQYVELGLNEYDFTRTAWDERWEPIPLDRSDERLQKATAALDEAIEKIDASNGYPVEAPGERQYVLEGLRAASKTFKENAQIYWMQIKVFVLEPLSTVIKRFGNAAEGVAASAARAAIQDWLKTAFSKALQWGSTLF